MVTKLDRIAEIAKERPKEKFTSLMHLIDENILKSQDLRNAIGGK